MSLSDLNPLPKLGNIATDAGKALFVSLLQKLWPMLLPMAYRALCECGIKVLTAAKAGTFPESVKLLEPMFDSMAEKGIEALQAIELTLAASPVVPVTTANPS